MLPHNAALYGVHQARCDGMRLIGLVGGGASLDRVASVAAEATAAARQASSTAQPLPQEPVPDFPGYGSAQSKHVLTRAEQLRGAAAGAAAGGRVRKGKPWSARRRAAGQGRRSAGRKAQDGG